MLLFAFFLASQTATPPSAQPANAQAVLQHLKRTIAWYQHLEAANRGNSASTDVLIQDSVHSSSMQAVKLAFTFGRDEARRLSSSGQDETPTTNSSEETPAVMRANQRVARLTSQIQMLNAQLAKAPRKNRKILEDQLSALNADLQLAKTVQTSVRNMVSLAAAPGQSGSTGLLGEIDELASVVPAIESNSTQSPQRNATPVFQPASAGILELSTQAFNFARKRAETAELITSTKTLLSETEDMVAPLRDEFRHATSAGDTLSSTISSQTDPVQIEAARKQMDDLNVRIKLISNAGAPLAGQRIAINTTLTALEQWHGQMIEEYNAATRYLLVRGAVLLVLVVVILVVAEAFTRIAYRYVQDSRRRRQVLLLRRFAVGAAIVLVVILTVFQGFGSFATIAGFITAGIAVALQNVIVSIVAYFFLIGRYGLRVGDIVTVTGITGEVVEVGLLRFYLIELTGRADEAHSTGRVAVFSNSVIFQPSALLKHPSKTQYVWHQVIVGLQAESDPQTAQERVEAAVESIYDKYRAAIEQQFHAIQRSFNVERPAPRLSSRIRYTDSGSEITVRYPVEAARASEIDHLIVRRVRDEAYKDPKLALTPTGAPKVESVSA
jgi:small-conductance mechanosensitive channel